MGSDPSGALDRLTLLSGYRIVLFVGILGGVFDPGGETKLAACDRVLALVDLPLFTPVSVS